MAEEAGAGADYRPLHARLTESSHKAWRAFAIHRLISMTAVAEAVGLWLDDPSEPLDVEVLAESAERIEQERRTNRY